MPEQSSTKGGLRIALVYAAVGVLWIALSDLAVELLLGRSHTAEVVQTLKGWFFVSISALLVYLLTNRTISSIKQSEKALQESQHALSTLFENLPGMVYRCGGDPDCRLDFVSPGAVKLTGYSIADLSLKRKLTDLVLPEDREMARTKILNALDTRAPFKLVYRLQTADGRIKWAWEQGLGLYSAQGDLIAVEGFVADISERKRIEEALKRSEEAYKVLVEGTSDAILMVDVHRNIVSVNQALLDLFGYSRQEVIGKSVRILHPSEDSYIDFGDLAYPAIGHGPLRLEWELKKKDGTIFPVEGVYSVIMEPEGEIGGHVGILRDITERRKTERELREYRERLEEMVHDRTKELEEAQIALVQKEKLKTLGAIAAEVAHEIRNPLMSLGGFARRLQKKYPDSREAEIILRESERLETILNRMNDYLRPVDMKPRACHVNAILSNSVGLLASDLERDQVKVQLDLYPDLPPAHVDPAILTQVFVVMIRNAVGMMDTEKEITLRTYYGEHNVFVDMISSASAKKLMDPELMLSPLEDGPKWTGISSTFKLLKGMGGALSFTKRDSKAVFTVSLRKSHQHQKTE
jgi:PAS domain S-box-containing protein